MTSIINTQSTATINAQAYCNRMLPLGMALSDQMEILRCRDDYV